MRRGNKPHRRRTKPPEGRYAVQHDNANIYYVDSSGYRHVPTPMSWEQARDLKLFLEHNYHGKFNIITL